MPLKLARKPYFFHLPRSTQGLSDHISSYYSPHFSLVHSTLESTYLFWLLLLQKTYFAYFIQWKQILFFACFVHYHKSRKGRGTHSKQKILFKWINLYTCLSRHLYRHTHHPHPMFSVIICLTFAFPTLSADVSTWSSETICFVYLVSSSPSTQQTYNMYNIYLFIKWINEKNS